MRKLLERVEPEAAVPSPRARLFLNGLVMQLLNPKIAIFFLAFLPQFVDPAGPVALQILVLGSGGIYMGLGVSAALSGSGRRRTG